MRQKYILIILLLASLGIPGCAEKQEQYIRDGREYGTTSGSFRGRWWNFYERGRSFSDGRFYKEAIADFRKAIEGRDQDQWRARTYGMHFVDYFPHRELGIVYFQRRQFDLAVAELENSIRSAPSAKGHYFLNKARAAKLRQQETDMSAPELFIEGSSGERLTNTFTQVVKGVAEDDTYVSSINVGDMRVPVELARKRQVFSVEVPLQEGENAVRITATDLLGKSTEQDLQIRCDRTGPLVEILQVEKEGEEKVVRGVVSDDVGLQSLKINGRPWNITGQYMAYNFKFTLSGAQTTLVAVDRAGNVTRALLNDDEVTEDPLLSVQMASLSSLPENQPHSPVVSDAYEPMLAAAPESSADSDPPFIKLEDLVPDQETYDDHLLLEGMIVDHSPIQEVLINGEPIAIKNGRKIYFSKLKKLSEGKNEFLIVAIDTQGNRSERNIVINRKVQNIRRIGSRMSVAVLPFDHKGEASPLKDLIHDQMIDSFLEQKRFNMVERKKIDAILQELKLSSTNLVDPDQAADLGKIVAANAMLAGTVIESPDSVEIIGRLIDTETATILASNDVFGEDKSFSSLDNLLDNLAFKFKRDFPIFEGILIEVRKGGEVVIDIGAEKKVRPNLHLICYREGLEIKHPVTGRILGGEPEILGDLKIREVFENFSRASLEKQRGEVQVYDRVIAR